MDPKHWGRPYWVMMFSSALTYPEHPTLDDQHHYKRFFEELRWVLPCKNCKKHYRRMSTELPINPYLNGGRQAVFAWVLKIHNRVNRRLGKPELTAAQAMGKYFPNMTCGQARELGQKIVYEKVTIKQTGSGHGINTKDLLLLAVAGGALYYWYNNRN